MPTPPGADLTSEAPGVFPGVTAVSMAQSGIPRQSGRLRLLRAGSASDETLVRAHLDGDETAFPQLVERHQRLVHALVRRYARTADESADLVQKAFPASPRPAEPS